MTVRIQSVQRLGALSGALSAQPAPPAVEPAGSFFVQNEPLIPCAWPKNRPAFQDDSGVPRKHRQADPARRRSAMTASNHKSRLRAIALGWKASPSQALTASYTIRPNAGNYIVQRTCRC